jgi:hypothetical protein
LTTLFLGPDELTLPMVLVAALLIGVIFWVKNDGE